MLSEDRQIEMYETYGNNFRSWLISADNLLAASRVLKKQRDEFDESQLKIGDSEPDEIKVLFPELMLRGFAIECLLKSIWLKNGGKLTANGEYKGIPGANSHDLLQLSDANKISFTKTQRDVLKRLSLIMVSSGRYPISKKWSDNKIQQLSGGGKGHPSFWMYPSDDKKFEGIVIILNKHLET